MSKELAVSNTQAVVGAFTQTELDTLKSTIAKGASNEQFALFIQTCVNSGLNPFLNQIYCIVYQSEKNGPQMSMQIAVEGIVALAKKHPQYKGFIASEVKENDEFEIDTVTGEPIHKIKGLGNRGKTLGAYCVAYREGAPNIAVVVDTDQVAHLINSSIANTKKMWSDYRDDMLVKHAIKRAFKRQFGIEVAEDEPVNSVSSFENVPAYEPQRRDITAEADAAAADQQKPKKELQQQQPPGDEMKKTRAQMKAKFTALGITTKEGMESFIADNAKIKGAEPTLAEMKGLLKIMDMQIEENKAAENNDDLLE